MGFFSWNCKHCGLEILAPASLSQKEIPHLIYLTNVVAIDINGNTCSGTYDGYGRVNGTDITLENYSKQPDVYHNHCFFNNNIESDKYTGGSKLARNQGFFLSEDDLKKYFKDSKKRRCDVTQK